MQMSVNGVGGPVHFTSMCAPVSLRELVLVEADRDSGSRPRLVTAAVLSLDAVISLRKQN